MNPRKTQTPRTPPGRFHLLGRASKRSPKRRHHKLDKQLQRFLLLRMRQAVVAPETKLIHPQFLVVLDARNDLFRRADHGGHVQAFQFKLRTSGKLLFRAWVEEAVDRRCLVPKPRLEGAVETRDRIRADFQAKRCARDCGAAPSVAGAGRPGCCPGRSGICFSGRGLLRRPSSAA